MKEKQTQATQPIIIKAGERPDNSAIIAAREARKAQARAKQAQILQADESPSTADPRKAAVEAAIARAKARKQEQQAVTDTSANETVEPRNTTAANGEEVVDPRKAAIAAAIARAQAKKAAQQKVVNED